MEWNEREEREREEEGEIKDKEARIISTQVTRA